MAVFLFVAIMAALVLIGIGAVLAIIALAVGAALAGVGIISASGLIALANRKVSSGFQAFFLLGGTVGGLFSGIVLGIVMAAAFPQSIAPAWMVLAGGAGGLLAGVTAALLFNFAWIKLLAYFAGPKRFVVETREAGVMVLPEAEKGEGGH